MKINYRLKTYYLISPERLEIAGYKSMQYSNQKEIINELKSKKLTDSTLIQNKDKSIILLDKLNVICEDSKKDLQSQIFSKELKISNKNKWLSYLITALAIETSLLILTLKK